MKTRLCESTGVQPLDRIWILSLFLRPRHKGKEEREREGGIANEELEGWQVLIRYPLERSLLNMEERFPGRKGKRVLHFNPACLIK